MRFDDSLTTVLSADAAGGFGAAATWRQLVDLMGRGRIPADEPTIARLRLLRGVVAVPVRAASARALAFAAPPARLVGLFAEDELAIAAPVLRTATLDADAWLALLPWLSPAGRSVLRHRRDLPDAVARGLESFGASDFVLDFAGDRAVPERPAITAQAPAIIAPPASTPLSESPFVSLSAVARGLPVVAEALRHVEAEQPTGGFAIADIVARIDAFNRNRTQTPTPADAVAPTGFRFETDAAGVIRWVEGVTRAAVVGVSIEHAAPQGVAQLDGVAAGAFRRRTSFRDARLELAGASDARGSWRISGVPAFDHATGRFTGFRGAARRPRVDEVAARDRPARSAASEALRQLVHELRTPTNAIAGFAELIETELLGPVAEPYRGRAGSIRAHAADLIAAIDDLDMAARIEGNALELRESDIAVAPLLVRVIDELAPLARLRGAIIAFDPTDVYLTVGGDDRAIERLIGRLMAALVSAGTAGERIGVDVAEDGAAVALRFDRPAALTVQAADALLSLDAEREAEADGAPLLGTAFALRLAQNLAVELGGGLLIGPAHLTLRLPAADARGADQATSN